MYGGLVAKLCPTLVTPWTVAHLALLSMGFYRQEYWSELPFPSPEEAIQLCFTCTRRTLHLEGSKVTPLVKELTRFFRFLVVLKFGTYHAVLIRDTLGPSSLPF